MTQPKLPWATERELAEYVELQREDTLALLDPSRSTTMRLLTEWAHGEQRLREGGYRKRQLLELLQNGVDAAQIAGARITVRFHEGRTLYIANTGTPVTREGIEALLSMYNSPKRGQIGKFGIGFKSILAVSDVVDVFSRSVSLRFDKHLSERAVRKRLDLPAETLVPVMRLAWAREPDQDRQVDAQLMQLMEHHDTIVRIAIRDEAARSMVRDELDELRHEFLLFTGKEITLDCDGTLVSVTREAGEVQVLRVGGAESRWRVFARKVSIPPTEVAAAADAGTLYGTTDLPIAWAVPLDPRDAPGQFWSFFPLAERNRVPGILNAPFKTNDDRSNLIDGDYNRALFERCAELIVAALPSLRKEGDAAAHLDFLPRRDDGNNLARLLGDAVWKRARVAEIAPDSDGVLRYPTTVRTPPTAMPELLSGWRALASPADRACRAHGDVLREGASKRSGRWKELVESRTAETAASWLASVASADPRAAERVLELAGKLCGNDPGADPKTWRIVPDQRGALRTGPELLLDGDGDDERVLPTLAARGSLRGILKKLGVQEKNAEWHRQRQEEARARADWPTFWKRWREAPVDGQLRGNHLNLHLLTRWYKYKLWRVGSQCAIEGELSRSLPADFLRTSSLGSFLPDSEFHSGDELRAAGAVAEDPWGTSAEGSVYTEWMSWVAGSYPRSRKGRAPQLSTSPYLPMLLDLIAKPEYSAVLTSRWSKLDLAPWHYGYQRAPQPFPHPVVWALKRYGTWGSINYTLAYLVRGEPAVCSFLGVQRAVIEKVASGLLNEAVPSDQELRRARESLGRVLTINAVGKLSGEAAIKLYEAAARIGVVPDEVLVRGRPVTRKDLQVWSEPVDARHVLVVSPDALHAFERCGVPTHFAHSFETIEVFIELTQTVRAEERFPWLSAVLRPSTECLVDVWTGMPAARAFADKARSRLRLEESEHGVVPRDAILRAVEELGWLNLPRTAAPAAVERAEHLQREAQRLNAESPAARLLALVGRGPLERQLHEVRHLLRDTGAERVAETFVSKHGPGALRAVEQDLRALGYAPPFRWGTARAREFALALGFPVEFAGSSDAPREESIVVDGPVPYSNLHDFQRDVHVALARVLASPGDRAMVCLPTGAGKTRVVAESVLDEVLRPRGRVRLVLWVAQQDELCEQAVQTFRRLWQVRGTDEPLTISRLWQGNRPGPAEGPHVVVATIQTLLGRFECAEYAWLQRPAVVVVDEAHHGTAKSYTALLDWLDARRDRRMPVIGLSATPHRGVDIDATVRLARRFDQRLLPPAERQPSLYDELLKKEVLARPEHSLLELPKEQQLSPQELEQVNTFHELPPSVSERLAEDPERNRAILARVLAAESTGRTLLFAASVAHATYLASALAAHGCAAAAIHGGTPPSARRYFLREFHEGRLRVLANYGVLTTGFDEPLVDTVLVARPTLSPVLYTQMIGRGLRGRANGGTERCSIVTVVDNWVRYKDGPAWKWFVEFWSAQRL